MAQVGAHRSCADAAYGTPGNPSRTFLHGQSEGQPNLKLKKTNYILKSQTCKNIKRKRLYTPQKYVRSALCVPPSGSQPMRRGGTRPYASSTTMSNCSAEARHGELNVEHGRDAPLSNMESTKSANPPAGPPPSASELLPASWNNEFALLHRCTTGLLSTTDHTNVSPLP